MFWVVLSRRRILRGAGFFITLLALAAMTSTLGSRTLTTTANPDQPLQRVSRSDKRVALTFDVTWGTQELPRLLSALDAQGVKATFFVGGTFLKQHSDWVRRLAVSGHDVGTLGQKVVDLSQLSEQEVTTNLMASQSALSKLLGDPVRYFRPPLGPATPEVVRAARAADLITVTYSLDSGDQQGLTAEQIVRRVVRQARPGDIIRMTASDWSPETAKALPDLIRGLKEKGFELVPLSELVQQGTPADASSRGEGTP
ncbi:MAG TPA: polysaccharide deacetylase family protein [Symbiobacteriaceae bacterium]